MRDFIFIKEIYFFISKKRKFRINENYLNVHYIILHRNHCNILTFYIISYFYHKRFKDKMYKYLVIVFYILMDILTDKNTTYRFYLLKYNKITLLIVCNKSRCNFKIYISVGWSDFSQSVIQIVMIWKYKNELMIYHKPKTNKKPAYL